ncbi:GntR family transcriptional regulator [Arthrobacter sp. AFG20]|uniref:GntR family transcriptional regulator n=1 Tax=Arthrobacter sp. AFG20 TaxID=1688671 RepID=UPI0015E1319D|nr:GntR family transcriptional regulator [Arthrobacter sp. AFG20]
MLLDRLSPTPLHVQLEEAIKDQIANEECKPNTKIPSENEFSVKYGLSRMTVRAVITRLMQQGLVYRVPGKGTFVAEPKIANRPHLMVGIQQQLDEMGVPSKVQVLSVSRLEAPGRIRKELNLGPGEVVFRVERLRTVNGEPLSIHLSYIPASLCPDLDRKNLEAVQLRDVLKAEYGLRSDRIVTGVETALASEGDAHLLQVKPGFTLLQMEETNYDESGAPFEYCHNLYRGDKMKVSYEFQRPPAD